MRDPAVRPLRDGPVWVPARRSVEASAFAGRSSFRGSAGRATRPDRRGVVSATTRRGAGRAALRHVAIVASAVALLTACSWLGVVDPNGANSAGFGGDPVADGADGVGVTPDPSLWTLHWSDEFNGTALDSSTWTRQVEPAGRFNAEWQRYTADAANAYVTGGNLVIEAIHDGGLLESNRFSSARLITWDAVEFTYGRVQARIRVPEGQGIWPAFWMLGANISENPGGTVSWPQSGEIDIMEKTGGTAERERTLHGTIHWANAAGGHAYQGESVETPNPLADAFHVYEIEWNASQIIWRFDGVEYHPQSIVEPEFDEFRRPFYILLNVAVGGNWPGYPDATTTFPQRMVVDWVRVYQRAR